MTVPGKIAGEVLFKHVFVKTVMIVMDPLSVGDPLSHHKNPAGGILY